MPFPLEKPHPILLPSRPSFPSLGHNRTLSMRASPTRPRITDELLADLSPTTTLAAFTSSSSVSASKLVPLIEAASTGEREFGIRAATAASKVKEWVEELQGWPWPESGSGGFEAPVSKRQKILNPEEELGASDQEKTLDNHGGEENGHERPGSTGDSAPENLYCGSLYVQDVVKYSTRIDEILDDMDDLDVGGIKSHILDLHDPSRSRSNSSTGASPMPISSIYGYQKLDDFTAVITATVLQTLPHLARLQALMDTWGIRLVVLRQINPLLKALEDAETAVKFGWKALNIATKSTDTGNEENHRHVTEKRQHLTRDSFNTMQQVMQSKVTLVGQKLDRMLDSLEGRPDTLPDIWLDRMDLLERQYADWIALATRNVLEGEWEKQNIFASESRKPVEKTQPIPTVTPPSETNEERESVSETLINDNSAIAAGIAADPEHIEKSIDHLKKSPSKEGLSHLPSSISPLPISQLDGVREFPKDEFQTQPYTPTMATAPSFGLNGKNLLPSVSPVEKSLEKPNTKYIRDQPQLEVETSAQQNATVNQEISTEDKKISGQSPVTPTNLPDSQTNGLVLGENFKVSRHDSVVGEKPAVATKSLSQDSDAAHPTSNPSVTSNNSDHNASPVSPSATKGQKTQHNRRMLSTIQSSGNFLGSDAEQAPTKVALREDYNTSNLPSSKHDIPKTPQNESFDTQLKAGKTRNDSNDGDQVIEDDQDDNVENENRDGSVTSAVQTPCPKGNPTLFFDKASPETALPTPLPTKEISRELLASPEFSSPSETPPETPVEPPVLPNIDLTETPVDSPTKKSAANQLQQQISEILNGLPTRIRLANEPESEPFPELKIPKKRPALKKTASNASMHTSRSVTPTPSFTLVPAYGKGNPRPRHQHGNPDIKLYHLSRSNGGAPIKLFVRLVGEDGQRVMVRVGGGWADLGEYLREYAMHHSRRNAPEDQIHIHDSSSRIVSTSSISSARNGRSSPISRSGSAMDGPYSRPTTSMGNSRTPTSTDRPTSSLGMNNTVRRPPRKSFGEEARHHTPHYHYQHQHSNTSSPSTPMPSLNRRAVSRQQETPPSAASIVSRTSTGSSSTRHSFGEGDSGGSGGNVSLGMSGPRSKNIELSEESEKWVESMTEKIKKASAEKEKRQAKLGELGKAGGTKRLFRKG